VTSAEPSFLMSHRKHSSWPSRRIIALVLGLIAGLALLERYVSIPLGLIAPALIGVAFLLWALLARQPAFLIPGGILMGIGGGLIAERLLTAGVAVDRAALLLGMGTGFLLVTVLSKLIFRQRVLWPLIPAGALVVIGLVHLAGADLQQGFRLARQLWPFAALLAAAWLWWSAGRRR
jgi:hypothetical protein